MVNSWTCEVEWTTDHGYIADTVDEWVTALESYSVIIDAGQTDGGDKISWSATMTVEASTLRQAVAEALRAVEGATSNKVIAIDITPTEQFDRLQEQPLIPELVGYAEIAQLVGVSRQRARELTDLPGFPPPVVEAHSSGPLRVKSTVEAWLAGWERKVGRPAKKVV